MVPGSIPRGLWLPEEECLPGAEVSLAVAALILLVALEPPRRAVRAEHLECFRGMLGERFLFGWKYTIVMELSLIV